MARVLLIDEIATVAALCRSLGLGDVAPTLLKAAHHTTLLVAPLAIVARVQSAGGVDQDHERALRELAATRHLADRGAPVVAPLAGTLAGPHVVGSTVVTLWPHIEHRRPDDDADAPLAATTLAMVHRGLATYRGALPFYTRALDRCGDVLAAGIVALNGDDQALLAAQYRRLRGEVAVLADHAVPLHGDVHLGNLLLGRQGPLWADFEDACIGPRELDIAGLPPGVWCHFAEADQMLIARCADLKSVCVAIWCWADLSRDAEVRDAADYHLDRVRQFAR